MKWLISCDLFLPFLLLFFLPRLLPFGQARPWAPNTAPNVTWSRVTPRRSGSKVYTIVPSQEPPWLYGASIIFPFLRHRCVVHPLPCVFRCISGRCDVIPNVKCSNFKCSQAICRSWESNQWFKRFEYNQSVLFSSWWISFANSDQWKLSKSLSLAVRNVQMLCDIFPAMCSPLFSQLIITVVTEFGNVPSCWELV